MNNKLTKCDVVGNVEEFSAAVNSLAGEYSYLLAAIPVDDCARVASSVYAVTTGDYGRRVVVKVGKANEAEGLISTPHHTEGISLAELGKVLDTLCKRGCRKYALYAEVDNRRERIHRWRIDGDSFCLETESWHIE